MTKSEMTKILKIAQKDALNCYNATGVKAEEVCYRMFTHLLDAMYACPVFRCEEEPSEEDEE